MKEIIFGFLSTVLQIDLLDTHATPFALPLMLGCLVAGTFGFVIFKMVGNEQPDESETAEETANRIAREKRIANELSEQH